MTDSTGRSDNLNSSSTELPEDTRPFVAPCIKLSKDAPIRWLKLGWHDFQNTGGLSFAYGMVMVLIGVLVSWSSWQAHSFVLAIALVGGFFFVGPVIAIGLYSMSRQLEVGMKPEFIRCLRASRKRLANMMILSFVFLVVFLIWARAASMVHVFFPSTGEVSIRDLGVFLGVGTTIGALFASIVFCVGAFSIPMLLDRKVDPVTAVISSINAVLHNKLIMLYWALLIVTGILLGILAGFIGLAVSLPVIGHASWHAYREVINAEAWERSPGIGKLGNN